MRNLVCRAAAWPLVLLLATVGSAGAQVPGAPTDLTATADGDTAIVLSWTEPADTGGSAITGYQIEVSSDAGENWADLETNTQSTGTTYTHGGHSEHTTRHYRVSAINGSGSGDASDVASATTLPRARAPAAPTNLTAVASGDTAIDLSWTAPADTGTSAITGYRIEVSGDGGVTWADLVTNTGSVATTHRDSGLAPRTTRHYRVSAINEVGTGEASTVAAAETSATVPDAPTGLRAEAGDGRVDLNWEAPADDGGAAITGYRVEYSKGGDQWGDLEEDTESTGTRYRHRDTEPGTTYHYRVRAINEEGESRPSNVAEATTAAVVPDAPANLAAEADGSTEVDLDWDPPARDGGSAITGYRIEYSTDVDDWRDLEENTERTATRYVHRNADPGATYYYRVRAINDVGESEPSNVARATTEATVPDAPTGLVARAEGEDRIDLSWTPPAFDGGSVVTGYRIEASYGGINWVVLTEHTQSTATTWSHEDLEPATEATYRVAAVNVKGHGGYSNMATARTDATVPGAPRGLNARPVGTNRIDLSWTPPIEDGGAEIEGYRILADDGSGQFEVLANHTGSTATIWSHTGLDPGTRHSYQVRAINEAGAGAGSNIATARTDPVVPDAPVNLVARAGGTSSIVLTWWPPEYTGGAPVTGYRIEVNDGSAWSVLEDEYGPATTYTHGGLEPGDERRYRVFAINEAGAGEASNDATAAADPVIPGPPGGLQARADGPHRIELDWRAPAYDGGADITGYRIHVRTDGGSGWGVLEENTGTSDTRYTHAGLEPATENAYRVAAINAAGASHLSGQAAARTDPVVPGPPGHLRAQANGPHRIDLYWDEPAYTGGVPVTGYRIEAYDGTLWTILVADTRSVATSWSHTELEPGSEWRYRVSAINEAGASEPSSDAIATTDPVIPGPPANLEATADGPHRIDLEWRPPVFDGGADITGHRIHVLQSGESEWRVLVSNTGTPDTRYSHTGLEPATENQYRVSAINPAGASDMSEPATARTDPVAPGPPGHLRAQANGPHRIDLDWDEPAYTGGVPVTGYRIEAYDGTLWTILVADTRSVATSWSHTELEPGSEWRYRVSAINEAGASEPSSDAIATTDPVIPGPPANLEATADGPHRIDLEWRPPVFDGGADITGHRIHVLQSGESEWRVLVSNTGTPDTRYSHTGLEPATENQYRVSAINPAGAGDTSEPATARTDPVAPDPPANLRAEADGPHRIDLDWDEPGYTGGVPVTGYRIEAYDGTLWTVVESDTRSGTTSWSHTELEPGSEWRYRVSAINEAGAGDPSDMATATTAAIPPDPPVGLEAEADGAHRMRLEWIAPEYTGGAPITGYRIEGFRGEADWTVVAETRTALTSYVHRDLEPASTWYYRVSAINGAGAGTPSGMASATTDPVRPDPPTGLRAEALGSDRIDLYWETPAYTGGAPVTGYQIQMSEDGGASWGMLVTDTRSESTHYRHTGIPPGSARYYRVSAINRAGVSDPSADAFAKTEATVPDAPGELRAVAIDHERISLSWVAPPFDGGAPVSGYRIQYSMDGGVSWDSAEDDTQSNDTEYVHGGLEPATTYHYRVAAINEKGAGAATGPVSVRTDATVPDAPTDLEAVATTPRQITLTWTAPGYDGGAAVTSYRVEVSLDGDEWEVLDDTDGPEPEYAHDGLAPGDTRHYRVSATNEAGTGEPSNVASATTDDPVERAARVNEAILPRFASAVTAGIVEAVGTRVRAVAEGAGDQLRAGNIAAARTGGLGDVMGGSRASRNIGSLSAAWASMGSVSHGAPGAPGVRWEGGLFSAHAGSDVRLPNNLLAGLALSRSSGSYDWTDATNARSVAGTYEARMTSITPYAAWTPGGRASVWTAASYGRGGVEIDDELAGTRESTATMRTGAAGLTGRLLANGSGALNVRAEGWASWMDLAETDGMDALELQVRRVRAAIEWTQLNRFDTGHEFGLLVNGGFRYELNEGVDDVNGMEVGGGLRYASPTRRLQVEGRGRLLLTIDSDYEEWGIGGNIQFDPGAGGGLALRLNPSYGRAESGVDALWANGVTTAADPGRSKLAIHTEYQFGDGLLATPAFKPVPYARAELLGPARGLWLGTRLRWLDLEGTYDRKGPALAAKGAWHW